MTVLQASEKIYKWYSENDSFSLEKDFKKIIMISDHPERDKAAFLSALSQLENAELISSSEIDGEKYWVLRKSFLAFPQTVGIDPSTALAIAELINGFCDLIDDSTEQCDPTNIRDEDVRNLIYIGGLFVKKGLDENGDE